MIECDGTGGEFGSPVYLNEHWAAPKGEGMS